jgi:hypothetical protein
VSNYEWGMLFLVVIIGYYINKINDTVNQMSDDIDEIRKQVVPEELDD